MVPTFLRKGKEGSGVGWNGEQETQRTPDGPEPKRLDQEGLGGGPFSSPSRHRQDPRTDTHVSPNPREGDRGLNLQSLLCRYFQVSLEGNRPDGRHHHYLRPLLVNDLPRPAESILCPTDELYLKVYLLFII